MDSNESEAGPDNPYNIDFARERRLKRMFQFLIAGALATAFILLAIGYALDAFIARRSPEIAPVTPYSTPATPGNTPVTPR